MGLLNKLQMFLKTDTCTRKFFRISLAVLKYTWLILHETVASPN